MVGAIDRARGRGLGIEYRPYPTANGWDGVQSPALELALVDRVPRGRGRGPRKSSVQTIRMRAFERVEQTQTA